jgi:hypothetical protein
MKFDSLIVNGCSYMEQYTNGNGHVDLAEQLGISHTESLAIGGSCNSRIIRTTLKHSYQTDQKCLYIIGLTFLSRTEIPVLSSWDPKRDLSFEGKWLSLQNNFLPGSEIGPTGYMSKYDRSLDSHIKPKDIRQFIDLKLKFESFSVLDRLEDLQFRIVSMIESLQSRGHDVILYNQADDIFLDEETIDNKIFDLLNNNRIIDRLRWRAVVYQHYNGTPMTTDEFERGVPLEIRHPQVGHHQNLNNFLINYLHSVISL